MSVELSGRRPATAALDLLCLPGQRVKRIIIALHLPLYMHKA